MDYQMAHNSWWITTTESLSHVFMLARNTLLRIPQGHRKTGGSDMKALSDAEPTSLKPELSINVNFCNGNSATPKIHEKQQQQQQQQQDNSSNSNFWSASTSPVLRNLTEYAGYSEQQKTSALAVYERFVVGSLGPCPFDENVKQWKSFMTDDFTPIEFSWSWATTAKPFKPKIRFSIEPISEYSGSVSDPWNVNPTLNLMHKLENSLPNLDTGIFHDLICRMKPYIVRPPVPVPASSASPTSVFLAFELEEQEPIIKAYILPFRSIAASKMSCGALTVNFLVPFAREKEWSSLSDLLEFLECNQNELGIEPFMIAFDCVSFSQTRMKIYVRSTDTSFRQIRKIMSLFQDLKASAGALDDLHELYRLVFDIGSNYALEQPLKAKSHETAGILYYLEVRPGSKHVTLKVYLPIKHYATSDRKAVEGLTSFLKRKRGCEDPMIDNYVRALEDSCAHRKLEEGTGLQTYLSCAIKNGKLDITSYINPEINHSARGGQVN